jgi:YgiT-type zinc finger domain-containing protein
MREFGYRCEHCDGTVLPKRVKREAFKHKARFVILEDVTVGVCNQCASRFYTAETLKRVDEVPVAHVR